MSRLPFIISLLFFMLVFSSANAQLKAGVKVGVSNYDYANPDFGLVSLMNDRNEIDYNINVEDVNWGYHIGFFTRLSVWKLFLQLEALGNSATVNYKVEDIANVTESILKEQYTTLDIPVQLGWKNKWLNISGGINGHLPISTISELRTIEGYDINTQDFTFSYLGGIGFDIWKIRLDFRYELNTSLFGNEIMYMGNVYTFENADNRILASIGYEF